MIDIIYVFLGTKNKSKVAAVEKALKIIFPNAEKRIFPTDVSSGVGNQPFGFDEIIKGAINRARAAKDKNNNLIIGKNENILKIGLGIEAGIIKFESPIKKFMDFQFTAILQENGRISLGCSSGFEYPIHFIEMIKSQKNLEIGGIIDNLTNKQNFKEKNGAIGFLSKNSLKRSDILMNGVMMALLPIINRELYND